MAKKIYIIESPFGHSEKYKENMRLYRDIVRRVAGDPEAFLYYNPDSIWYGEAANEYKYRLRDLIGGQPSHVSERIGTTRTWKSWACLGDEPVANYTTPAEFNRSVLRWALISDSPVAYDPTLSVAYLNISDARRRQTEVLRESGKLFLDGKTITDDGRRLLRIPLDPAMKKLIQFLGPIENFGKAEGETTVRVNPADVADVKIFGSGEYINACVMYESIFLARALGIPLDNITLNTRQPNLLEGGATPVFRRPAVYLRNRFPEQTSVGMRHHMARR